MKSSHSTLKINTILDDIPCGYTYTSPCGKILEANQFLYNVLGYNESELINEKSIFDILSKGSKIFFETHLFPIIKMQGYLNEVNILLLSKKGKEIPVLINCQKKTDTNNKIIGTSFSIFEIIQRKSFEEQLVHTNKKNKELILELQNLYKLSLEKNKLIQGVIKDSPIALYSFQMNSIRKMSFPYVNEEFKLMFSDMLENNGEINLHKVISKIHPEDQKEFLEKINESYQNLSTFMMVTKTINKEGKISYYKMISHPFKKTDDIVFWNGSIEDITERKLIEENSNKIQSRLSAYKSKFDIVTLSNHLGLWELTLPDFSGTITKEFYNLIGRGDEISGDEINRNFYFEVLQYIHPDDKELFVTKFNDYASNPISYLDISFRLAQKNGNWIWIWTKAEISKSIFGNVLIGTCVDITSQKILELNLEKNRTKLLETNQNYINILNNSNDLIQSVDSNGIIKFVNDKWIEKLGYEIENVLGKNILEFIHPDSKELSKKLFREILNGKTHTNAEIEFISFKGKKLFTKALIVASFIDGKLISTQGFFVDITDKKKQEFLLYNAINNIHEGYCLVNKNFVIKDWNLAIEELTGLKRSIVLDTNLFDVFNIFGNSETTKNFYKLIRKKTNGAIEIYSEILDAWYFITTSNVNEGLAFFVTDISERKRNEGIVSLEKNIYTSLANNSDLSIKEILYKVAISLKDIHPKMIFSTLRIEDDKLYNWVSPELSPKYIKVIDGSKIGSNQGSCGTAAFKKENVFVSDIETDNLWKNYKDLALSFNLKSCWSIPLIIENDKLIGTFAIYHNKIRKISHSEYDSIERVKYLIQNLIELKNAQVKKFQSDYLKNKVIDSSLISIIITKEDGSIILFNPLAQKMFGWKEEEVLNKNIYKTILAADTEKAQTNELKKFIKQAEKSEFRNEIELMVAHKNGIEIPVEIFVATVKEDTANILIYFVRDLSTFKKQFKTIQFQNKQLKEIAWMQSHVIRAPLTRIMSLVNLINSQDKDEVETKELLDYISISANELDKVIHEISNKTYEMEISNPTIKLDNPKKTLSNTEENEKQLQLLLVDDDPIILTINKLLLKKNGFNETPFCFKNGKTATEHILNNQILSNKKNNYLVFLDINMPVMNGWEFLDEIKKHGIQDRIFVIMLTSSSDNFDRKKADSYQNIIEFYEKPLTVEQVQALKYNAKIIPLLQNGFN
jgi:PAS domain S-box-containing protein